MISFKRARVCLYPGPLKFVLCKPQYPRRRRHQKTDKHPHCRGEGEGEQGPLGAERLLCDSHTGGGTEPVNTVDLPTLGLPARAMTRSSWRSLKMTSSPSAAQAPVEVRVRPISRSPYPGPPPPYRRAAGRRRPHGSDRPPGPPRRAPGRTGDCSAGDQADIEKPPPRDGGRMYLSDRGAQGTILAGEACARRHGHMLSRGVFPWTTTPISIPKRAIN